MQSFSHVGKTSNAAIDESIVMRTYVGKPGKVVELEVKYTCKATKNQAANHLDHRVVAQQLNSTSLAFKA